ncbi:hypothetical protein FOA52_006286 [Chlamydomonas sp. UWO 241]|nr:hypothetical protein FOA52_006286 [Chlamydomonas sp. UWO 241]
MELERLIGVSSAPGPGCVAASSSLLAFAAGATCVLYDAKTRTQTAFLRNADSGRPFGATAFSRCGTYVAAGKRGPASEVAVFEVGSGARVSSLQKCHKHGVACIAFSPDGRLKATTGPSDFVFSLLVTFWKPARGPSWRLMATTGPHDTSLCVWDWRAGTLLVRVSAAAGGLNVAFSEDGGSVVTSGKEHFKVWSISVPPARGRAPTVILAPKPTLLKEFKSCTFVGVAPAVNGGGAPGQAPAGSGGVYTLTSSGVLLLMRAAGRSIDKSVNLQVDAAFCLSASPSLVACGCAGGTVRLFATRTLAFKANLPRPSPAAGGACAGAAGDGVLSAEAAAGAAMPVTGSGHPDCVALSFAGSSAGSSTSSMTAGSASSQLAALYSDRQLLLWDVGDLRRIVRVRVLQPHSAGIWDAALLPLRAGAAVTHQGFLTAGADGSVRLWGLSLGTSTDLVSGGSATAGHLPSSYRAATGQLPGSYRGATGCTEGAGGGAAAGTLGGASDCAVSDACADSPAFNYAKQARTLRGIVLPEPLPGQSGSQVLGTRAAGGGVGARIGGGGAGARAVGIGGFSGASPSPSGLRSGGAAAAAAAVHVRVLQLWKSR